MKSPLEGFENGNLVTFHQKTIEIAWNLPHIQQFFTIFQSKVYVKRVYRNVKTLTIP